MPTMTKIRKWLYKPKGYNLQVTRCLKRLPTRKQVQYNKEHLNLIIFGKPVIFNAPCPPQASYLERSDQQLLAQFYYADDELIHMAAKLKSLEGTKETQHCALLISQFRSCQDSLLSILNQIMNECIPGERANQDFCVKFPEEIRHDNLGGQLWFGAECLASGSDIMNQEAESVAMRPLAKKLTQSIKEVRSLARNQALRDVTVFPQRLCQALRHFDCLFAEFELSYVSAMVPVKSPREYDMQQDITVLFCETVSRALKRGYITQDMIDDYEPALMFTIPRLAIVCGLVVFPEGPLKLDGEQEDMSELFRPFQSLLKEIRGLLWTLRDEELQSLERSLCATQENGLIARRRSSAIPLTSPAFNLTQQLKQEKGAESQPRLPPDVDQGWFVTEDYVEKPPLLQVNSTSLEQNPEAKLSSSIQSDINELEQLNMMFYQVGNEMSSLLSAPSQTLFPAPQRRVGTASLRASPCSLRRSGQCFGGSSLPSSPLLGVRRDMSCPSSPRTSLSRQCVEAALQRSKNFRNPGSRPSTPCSGRRSYPCPDSRPSTPDSDGSSAPSICLNMEEVDQEVAETAEVRGGGIELSATVFFNPRSANLFGKTAKDDKKGSEEDEEEEKEAAPYCQLIPCICFRCPSAPPFEPDDDRYSWLTPSTPSTPRAVQDKATVTGMDPREEREERGQEQGSRPCSPRGRGQLLEGAPVSCVYPSLTRWSTSGNEEEKRRGEGLYEQYGSTNTLSPSCSASSLTSYNILDVVKEPAHHNIRSHFQSSGDLLHRLFVCISGVADQLQSNYASDLRVILKALFEIMTTKSELAEEDQQRKASLGLCDIALEDCALCKEWLSSSTPLMGEDIQCEDLPAWVPDEACSMCTACNSSFRLIRKKHHCRSCGKIFCSRCSAYSAPLPRYGQVKPVRVCTHCYVFHVTPFCSTKTGN